MSSSQGYGKSVCSGLCTEVCFVLVPSSSGTPLNQEVAHFPRLNSAMHFTLALSSLGTPQVGKATQRLHFTLVPSSSGTPINLHEKHFPRQKTVQCALQLHFPVWELHSTLVCTDSFQALPVLQASTAPGFGCPADFMQKEVAKA